MRPGTRVRLARPNARTAHLRGTVDGALVDGDLVAVAWDNGNAVVEAAADLEVDDDG